MVGNGADGRAAIEKLFWRPCPPYGLRFGEALGRTLRAPQQSHDPHPTPPPFRSGQSHMTFLQPFGLSSRTASEASRSGTQISRHRKSSRGRGSWVPALAPDGASAGMTNRKVVSYAIALP